MWHIHTLLVKKKIRKSVIQPKSKAQVYSDACDMCHDDATPHIMTHDAVLIVMTPFSHGTHFIFTLSTLSLSLSLYIFYFLSQLSSSSREEVVEDVEENKEEEGEEVLRMNHATIYVA
jgi:hypothetical protein